MTLNLMNSKMVKIAFLLILFSPNLMSTASLTTILKIKLYFRRFFVILMFFLYYYKSWAKCLKILFNYLRMLVNMPHTHWIYNILIYFRQKMDSLLQKQTVVLLVLKQKFFSVSSAYSALCLCNKLTTKLITIFSVKRAISHSN